MAVSLCINVFHFICLNGKRIISVAKIEIPAPRLNEIQALKKNNAEYTAQNKIIFMEIP